MIEHYADDAKWIMLLQPTSPLRSVEDIDRSIEWTVYKNAKSCISVTEFKKNINWLYAIKDEKFCSPFDHKIEDKIFIMNGALYFFNISWYMEKRILKDQNTLAFIMPEERSIDIDEESELILAEFWAKQKNR